MLFNYKKIIKSQKLRLKILRILSFLPDEFTVKYQYLIRCGRRLNLKNPKRYSEKIQWYKLNYRVPLLNTCADKYAVREYVKSKGFAGGHIPEFDLLQMYYKYHKIDVLWIKSSKHVPFYLSKKYKDVGTQIYTRVGDTNTPKDESASYNDIEKLWRIHFERENE